MMPPDTARPEMPDRRSFLTGVGALGVAAGLGTLLPGRARAAVPDFQLSIGKVSLELAPGKLIETIGYNGMVPGPLIRVAEGQSITIEVTNTTTDPELVHWHGLMVPSVVDGAAEEGTPFIQPGATTSYSFAANPAGTRWYHSHVRAGKDLGKSLYTGQFGFFMIDAKDEPGLYDQEVFVAMHQWEPSWIILQDIRKGPPADNGFEVGYKSASFNGKMLGHGEPVRVKQGQRVLFRLLNASATEDATVALPGHRFTVTALDGNPVPVPKPVDRLTLAPAERIDAVVEMTTPGVWVFGSTDDAMRGMGMGMVIEYAGASGPPVWQAPPPGAWDYLLFGKPAPLPEPAQSFDLVIGKIPGGRGGFNRWTINGKSWPDHDPIRFEAGKRYRLVFRNQTGDSHPMHLHRHSFELTNFDARPTAGIMKDVINVPGHKTVVVDQVANDPGPSLLHCHMQEHMDFGLMTIVEYA